MSRRVGVYRLGSVLVIVAMLAWAAWLASMARSKLDYLVAKAQTQAPLPACLWTSISTPAVSSLGLSFEPSHAWSERKETFLAFRTPSFLPPVVVDLRLPAVVGKDVLMSADGGKVFAVSADGDVRLPLRQLPAGSVHVVAIRIGKSLPPHGQDRRWLGVAISEVRVCGASGATGD